MEEKIIKKLVFSLTTFIILCMLSLSVFAIEKESIFDTNPGLLLLIISFGVIIVLTIVLVIVRNIKKK